MAVRVAKIDAAAAVPIIELTVLEAPRCAAVRELRLANAAQDGIELGIADVEGVVVALELLLVVEKERERVVETYRREMAIFRIGMEAKNARKKIRRRSLVVGRDDGVVEGDRHRKTFRYPLPQTYRSRQAIDRPLLGRTAIFITFLANNNVLRFAAGSGYRVDPIPCRGTADEAPA